MSGTVRKNQLSSQSKKKPAPKTIQKGDISISIDIGPIKNLIEEAFLTKGAAEDITREIELLAVTFIMEKVRVLLDDISAIEIDFEKKMAYKKEMIDIAPKDFPLRNFFDSSMKCLLCMSKNPAEGSNASKKSLS